MKIAVTGTTGQVARSLLERGELKQHEIVLLGRPDLDLTDPTLVVRALETVAPDAIVSAAAYTAVDKAESERDLAFAVNAIGAGAVASAANKLGVPLVHISTDYVFDGQLERPYLESDATGPTGVYGASKLAGEEAVLSAHRLNTAVLRVAWVYSPFGNNFVKTMLRLAADRDEVGVVADQVGNPTSALDIADGILSVLENLGHSADPALRGVFHMTATNQATWAEFAEAVFAASGARGGPSARVRPIATSDYPTPAKRPANSRLDCRKIEALHGIKLPDWREALEPIISRL